MPERSDGQRLNGCPLIVLLFIMSKSLVKCYCFLQLGEYTNAHRQVNSKHEVDEIMKSPARAFRDIVAPSHEALWQRAMTDMKTYDDLPDGTRVPIFNPQLIRHEEIDGVRILYDAYGNATGTKRKFESETSFGIDYASSLYQPIGEPQHDFYIDIDTPLSTGVEGLNDEVAMRLVQEIGVPVILKGPEFSAAKSDGVRRLAKAALAATNISQSFSAESSMEISAQIVHDEGLPTTAVVYGKSRGAMIGGKKHSYANERGINVVHYRLIDPCVGERALGNIGDTIKYAAWPATDMAKSLPSFARFALEGNLRSRARTVETSLAYLTGMVAGTIPSLLAGEAMGSRIPLEKGVSLVHMASNPIADTEAYLEQFKDHKNFDHHEIHDTHIGGIILPRNIRRTVRHLNDFAREYESAGGDEIRINWAKVHNNPKSLDTSAGSIAA